MPTSHHYQLNEIIDLIVRVRPESVLDIGIGFGKYGMLAREYLELWGWEEDYNKWTKRIDGIEIYEPYIKAHHEQIYDHIYKGDVRSLLSNLPPVYDLVLLIDVLEHLSYYDGMQLLKQCLRTGKNVIISTPIDIGVQGTMYGNEHETHYFQWRKKHFKELGPCFFVYNPYSYIVFLGNEMPKIKKEVRYQYFKFFFKRYLPWFKMPYQYIKRLRAKT